MSRDVERVRLDIEGERLPSGYLDDPPVCASSSERRRRCIDRGKKLTYRQRKRGWRTGSLKMSLSELEEMERERMNNSDADVESDACSAGVFGASNVDGYMSR